MKPPETFSPGVSISSFEPGSQPGLIQGLSLYSLESLPLPSLSLEGLLVSVAAATGPFIFFNFFNCSINSSCVNFLSSYSALEII